MRIRAVSGTGDVAFRAAYALLRRAFPAAEMVPRRDWVATMREREAGLWADLNWHVLVAEQYGRVIGTATGSYLGNVNVGVIGYVALSPAARARGVGPRLRRRLRLAFERDARRLRGRSLNAILGEVSIDNPWLRYLVRHEGVIALDFPYYQPSLDATVTPVPLVLYYQPLGARRRSIRAAELRQLLYTMWRRPYRVARPLSRPAFRRMLRALEGRTRIGARTLPALPPRRSTRN